MRLFKFIIITAFVLLFTQCDSGKGSDSKLEEQPGNSQDSTIVVPIKQKMNKSNLVIKEWNTDVRTNTRVLDHVITYNGAGQKIEEIEYNSEGQKWRKRFEYDANGNKIQEAVYDGHNRLVNVKKSEFNEFGKKSITYTYNAKGTLTAIKNYEYLTQ